MNNAHQAAQKIVLIVACGNAHIFCHTTTKWMRGHVEPSGLEVELQQRHDLDPKRALLRQRKRPLRFDHAVMGLFGDGLANQFGQPAFDTAKNPNEYLLVQSLGRCLRQTELSWEFIFGEHANCKCRFKSTSYTFLTIA